MLGTVRVSDNRSDDVVFVGGALAMDGCALNMDDTVTLINNQGYFGGAAYLTSLLVSTNVISLFALLC